MKSITEIDNSLVNIAKRVTGTDSQQEAIVESLRTLIQLNHFAAHDLLKDFQANDKKSNRSLK